MPEVKWPTFCDASQELTRPLVNQSPSGQLSELISSFSQDVFIIVPGQVQAHHWTKFSNAAASAEPAYAAFHLDLWRWREIEIY